MRIDQWMVEQRQIRNGQMDALREYVVKPHSCQCRKCKAIMRKHNAWLNKGKQNSKSEFAKYFGKKSAAGGSKCGEVPSSKRVSRISSAALKGRSSPSK